MNVNIEKFKIAAKELNENTRTKGLKLELKKVTMQPVESDIELYVNIIKIMKEKTLVEADFEAILDETYGLDEDYAFYKTDSELYEIFYLNPLKEMVTSIEKSGILEKTVTTTKDVIKILVPQIFYNYRKNAFLENPELVLSIIIQLINKTENKLYKVTFDELVSVSEAIASECNVVLDVEDYIDSFNTIYSLFDLFGLEITIDPEEKLVKFGSKLLECFETNLLTTETDLCIEEVEITSDKANKVAKAYLDYFSE